MSFTVDITKFIEKTKLRSETVVRRIGFEMYKRVTFRTPVDTGRARANWQVGINRMPVGAILSTAKTTPDFSGFMMGDSIFIANNLPYIGVLEYGGYPKAPKHGHGKTAGGYSRQAPQGMVGITMREVDGILQAAMRGLK